MAVKTYHLLEHMHPKMSTIYFRVNKDQRLRHDKLPAWRPYLQMTFTDENGQNRTIRYKANTNEIFQDAQIKLGILANEKTLMSERDDLEFTNGVLTTGNETAQKFLETYPGYEKFKGRCNDIKQPQYKLYDAEKEIDSDNMDFLKRLKVGTMVAGLDDKGLENLLIRLNGSSYTVPASYKEKQNALIKYMNNADEDGLDEMLKTTMNDDELATVLLGKLKNAGLIEFNFSEGIVVRKKGNREIVVKNISADNEAEQQRLFIEYITSDAGSALYRDLEKALTENKEAAPPPAYVPEPMYTSFTMPLPNAKTVTEDEDDGDVAVAPPPVKVAVKKKKKKKPPMRPKYTAPQPVVKQENNISEPENISDNGL